MDRKTAAFTGGGTGGHVFPGLAVVEKIRETDSSIAIHWIGSSRGMEREIVEQFGIPFHSIPAGKLRRYFSLLNVVDVFRIIGGFFASLYLLRRLHVSILFSKGGFVSVPPVAAARVLGITVITHDSDLDPGLATRINAKFSRFVLVPYRASQERFSHRERVIVTGNPVRSEIFSGDPEKGRRYFSIPPGKKIILVLGGSQGAQKINERIALLVPLLVPEVFVVHQTGKHNAVEQGREGYVPVPFLTDMLPHILAAADIVISRAGAGTLWESGVTGKASLLIPLGRESSRGDQIRNAEYFTDHGAAIMLGSNPSLEGLHGAVRSLLEDDKKRKALGDAAMQLCNRDASDKIASIITENMTGG